MQELGVVDAHVHFWQPAELDYPWLAGSPALRRGFLPEDHAAASAGAGVEKLVFVEANCRADQALDEARWVQALAAQDARIAGVVAFLDLTDPESVGPTLEELAAMPLVRGIRRNIQGNPAGFCLQPSFVEGVQAVGRRGLGFDLCATHDQLEEVVELARRCPGTRLVLDHCGKPPIEAGTLDPWRGCIERLARLDHVSCKLSGLLTEAGGRSDDEVLLPFARHVADRFQERLMYGSDWPVLTLAGSYEDWFGFTRRFTRAWSESEARTFYRESASHFYGI